MIHNVKQYNALHCTALHCAVMIFDETLPVLHTQTRAEHNVTKFAFKSALQQLASNCGIIRNALELSDKNNTPCNIKLLTLVYHTFTFSSYLSYPIAVSIVLVLRKARVNIRCCIGAYARLIFWFVSLLREYYQKSNSQFTETHVVHLIKKNAHTNK